jgi:AcrR family transcriptional regulator
MSALWYNADAMSARQAPSALAHTRDGQRRRTRKAIVEAAAALIARGTTPSPSVADIAAAADVSRRTVYLYFPTLEQLLLDATLGLLTQSAVDQVLDSVAGDADDVEATLDRTIRVLGELTAETLPLGRSLIKLTVDRPAAGAALADADVPRRGYRRVEWIERAIAPLRERLDADAFERLVSALSLVIGWEAFVVLSDVRGLPRGEQLDVVVWSARAMVRAALRAARQPAETD